MNKTERLPVDQARLVQAWKETLPTTMKQVDSVQVYPDATDPETVRITVTTAGHSGYEFDFACKYVDPREVQVSLVDVEQNGVSIDERSDIVQQLAADYVRHIHECAQALHDLTNP